MMKTLPRLGVAANLPNEPSHVRGLRSLAWLFIASRIVHSYIHIGRSSPSSVSANIHNDLAYRTAGGQLLMRGLELCQRAAAVVEERLDASVIRER